MSTEKIAKILSNCEQGLSASEQAQARTNIGAQAALTAGNNITIADGVISATDTTYSAGNGLTLNGTEFSVDTSVVQEKLTAGPNIDIYNDVISTEKPRVEAGTNVSVNGVLDPQTRVITYTVSATDTTYNVFNTTTDGLVPKSSGTGDTGKFLKGNGTWDTPTDTTYNVFNTTTDGLVPKASGTGDTGKFLKGDGTWDTPATSTGVQEIVMTSNTYADVTAIITAGNEPVLSVADSNGAGFYRRVFTGLISTTPNPVTAVKFARLAGSVFEMYTIDSDTGNWVHSSVPLTKHRHDAELYFYNTDDGDHYHVRGIQNYAINHVAVQNHHGDICSVTVEAPTLGLNEEYDYVVVFDCSNSSGSCNASVQGCDCEIDTKWEVDTNASPLRTFAIDITNTLVGFSGSPQYQIEVLGNRWHRHKF